MNTLKTVGAAMEVAFNTLSGIASGKGQTVHSVNISVKGTDLTVGKVVGTVTVNNRSRRNFTMNVVGTGVVVKFMGEEKRIAA